MLCLSCHYVSPQGSVFCQRCGLSLGVRLCPKRHFSSVSAKFCGQCGSPELSEAARCLNLRGPSTCIAWLIIIALAVAGTLLAIGFVRSAGTPLAHRLVCWLSCRFGGIAMLLLAAYVGSFWLPEARGKSVRHGIRSIGTHLIRLTIYCFRGLVASGKVLAYLVHGKKNSSKRKEL